MKLVKAGFNILGKATHKDLLNNIPLFWSRNRSDWGKAISE